MAAGRAIATAAGVLAMVVLAAAPAAAQCKVAAATPAVKVKLKLPKVSYRTDASRRQLTAMSRGPDANGVNHSTTLGLTVTAYPVPEPLFQYDGERRNDGTLCARVTRLDVTLRVPAITVFVASEYARSSCAYDAILNHENEHVRIYQGAFRRFTGQLERDLAVALSRIGTIYARNEQELQGRVSNVVVATLRSSYAKMISQVTRSNGAIDTQQNYDFVASKCARW